MTAKNPEISVILPVYNGQEHIAECIESVLNQTFQDFEFIIVDDASNDSTPKILKKYSQKDDRIKVITHSKNQKQTAAANTAIKAARGKYLARIDADDVALPKRFERQYNYLEENLKCGMVGSWIDIIDENSDASGQWRTAATNGLLKWNLLFGTSFAHASVMMRTNIVKEVGLYQSAEAEDYDLWSRISKVSDVANIKQVLQQRRVWSGQLALKVPQETRDCVIQIMQKNISALIGAKDLSLEFIKKIRAVSDLAPVIEENESILEVRKVFIQMYSSLKQNIPLEKNEKIKIKKDLFRKLKTLSDWQLKSNPLSGLIAKICLFIRYPKYYIYILTRKIAWH